VEKSGGLADNSDRSKTSGTLVDFRKRYSIIGKPCIFWNVGTVYIARCGQVPVTAFASFLHEMPRKWRRQLGSGAQV